MPRSKLTLPSFSSPGSRSPPSLNSMAFQPVLIDEADGVFGERDGPVGGVFDGEGHNQEIAAQSGQRIGVRVQLALPANLVHGPVKLPRANRFVKDAFCWLDLSSLSLCGAIPRRSDPRARGRVAQDPDGCQRSD